jgi:hypothetical protein
MKSESNDRSRLAGFDTPHPSPELRDGALAAAREALARQPSPDLWSRLWFSRPLRIAWGLSVVACIVGHVAMSMAPGENAPEEPSMIASNAPAGQTDLEEIINLPWVDQSVLRDVAFANGGCEDRDQKGNAS